MNNNDDAKVAELRAYLDDSESALEAAVPQESINTPDFDVEE